MLENGLYSIKSIKKVECSPFMNDFLMQTYHRLINELDEPYQRFLFDKITLKERLLGIIGPRGVGKTTLMLQLIKEKLFDTGQAFYFSADNTLFNEISILSYVDELYQDSGIRYFFIDEIHKYANWSQELKNIYDSYPNVQVFFSGSSSIDLVTGSHDLSRRAQLHYLPGLSFREYLNISLKQNHEAVSWDDLLENHVVIASKLSSVEALSGHFKRYLSSGYYPTVFEARDDLYQSLLTVIDKTIYEDIGNFYNLKTSNLHHFKRILNFLATIPPGKVSVGNLAKHLQIDHKTADNYLGIMEKTGLVKSLYPQAHGNQVLTKANKVFLDNTTLLHAMNSFLATEIEVGTVRELAFLQFVTGAKLDVFHAKKGDFVIGDVEIEVGGKNKTAKQLQGVKADKLVVKDGISIGAKGVIPLYLFGFLY